MILLSAHPYTIKIWIILTTANSVIMAHSGFKIMADFHDYHHEKFTKNYGMNLFMDYLMGTKY
jgi:sterol desaturase/sphingolipid hydroxylase (fatty acid hydroxylase superfamily)